MSLITNGDLSQLHLSRAVTQRRAGCSVSPGPNTAQHHEMALQLQQRFSRAHDVWVRGCSGMRAEWTASLRIGFRVVW